MDNNQPQADQKNDQAAKPVISDNKAAIAKPADASVVKPADAVKSNAA